MTLSIQNLSAWLQRYFDAWLSNDPDEVSKLFSEEAVYYYGPFKEPARGKEVIVANWTANPQQQTGITCQFDVLAINGDVGVAHWNVTYTTESGRGKRQELDGILVLRFDSAIQCVEHREWYVGRDLD